MKLKPYPKTKPSGVEWLGDVPVHWEVKRFGYLFRFFSGGTPSTTMYELWDGDLPWVSSKDMKSMVIYDTEDHISEDAVKLSATCKLPAGSLLIVNRSGILKHSIPAAIILREMAINQDIRGCVPLSGVDSKFIAFLIEGNQNALLALWRQQGATVESLTFESVKTTNLYLPVLAEQRAIAAFLDLETRRIDLLVLKKRELIERLKEKRTALISRTVTRGLPPAAARAAGLPANPPLKSSGHPWLDDIPKHWDVKRLKEVSVLFGRIGFRGYSTDDLVYEGEGAISMSPSNMADGVVSLDKCTWLSWEKYHESPEIQVQPEDVIMVKTGSTLGKTAFVKSVPVPMTINPQLMIFKEVKCSKRFLFYYVLSKVVQDVIPLHNTGSTIPTMTQEGIGKLPFAHPPLPEQAAIAAYLDKETAKLDALVWKVAEAVERLQEYRTALITAAVTGKIDVTKGYEKIGV